MAISKKIEGMMERSSWIRKMFEEGAKLKAERGAENVFDFSLGNPIEEPSTEVVAAIESAAAVNEKGAHRYMPNAGYQSTREAVADSLSKRSGLPFTSNHIIMTTGAGGALNVVLKAILDPGDEVVIIAPYFPEYLFYIDNHQGVAKIAKANVKDFQLDLTEIEKAITSKTRAIILNSPNNPTGVIYSEESLKQVGDLLKQKSVENNKKIWLVMDEPYRKIVYKGNSVPETFHYYDYTISVTSHSKDLCLPGERIGYAAVSPNVGDIEKVMAALTLANRILGFVNAPALMQRAVASLQDVQPDMTTYEKNRNILLNGLANAGYEIISPGGAFYLFPKSPIEDDVRFVGLLKEVGVLVTPGTGFGWPGHFRISYCVETETCERAIAPFSKIINGM